MKRDYLAVVFVLAALVSSAVFAQGGAGTVNITRPNAVGSIVTTGRDLRPTVAELRMAAGAGGSSVALRRVALTAGRVMPYVGLALMTWELVDTALQWNKNRAQPLLAPNTDINCQFELVPLSECDGAILGVPMMAVRIAGATHNNCTPTLHVGTGEHSTYKWTVYERRSPTGSAVWDRTGVSGTSCLPRRPTSEYRAYGVQFIDPPWPAHSGGYPLAGPELRVMSTGSGDVIAERPVLLLHEGWDEEESVPWRTQMAENEPDVNEWVRRVIEDHWREQTEQGAPAFPATYGNPLPGVELQPAPNINEWLDNPFADPQLDTDGDGVEDWKEVVAGTNPQDPTSYPTTDPYPDPGPEPDPGWEPLPDTDGDGIPDIYDPCPFDALNRCADAENRTEPATDTTLQEILEELREQGRRDEADRLLDVLDILPDIAQENTLQDVRDAIEQGAQEETLGEILDVLERIEQQGETEPEPDPDPEPAPLDFGEVDVELGAWQPGQLTQDVWRDVETALAVVVTNVQQAADGKLVFLSSGWVPALSLSGSGECPAITMPILGHQQDVSVCNSPVHTVMATTARTALLALMVLAFWLGMTRWVAVS